MNRGKGKKIATSSCPLISDLDLEDREELSGNNLEAEYLETSTLSPPKKKIKKRSQVWQHFGEVYVADGIDVADCKHCKTRVGCDSKEAGMSSLWHHVNNNCSVSSQVNQPTIDQYQTKLSFDASSGTRLGNIRLNKLETKRIRRSLAEFLIEDELPFMLVQKSRFRKYSKNPEPWFNMISRHTVAKDCLGVYVSEKNLLKNFVRQLSQWFKFFLQQIMSPEDATKAVELAKQTVEDLFAHYNSLYGTSSSSTSQVGSSSTSGKTSKIQAWKDMIQTTQFNKRNELEEYLSEGPEDPDNPCIRLDWWKVKQNKFPVLARMARDILTIPISTVSLESSFSTGGRVLNVFRSYMFVKRTVDDRFSGVKI